MSSWPDSLVREIADRRAVVFIGSGISKFARSEMHLWPYLLRDLAKGLKKKKDRNLVRSWSGTGRLLDAAQIVTDGVNGADLRHRLQELFAIRPTPENSIYDLILSLDAKIVVTTNYDEFIERNFDRASGGNPAYSVISYKSDDLIDTIRSPQRAIVKMHGCITDVNGLVLDRVSYYEARRDFPGFFGILESLFTVSTVLFLGYSLSDPDMQLILENISMQSNGVNGHYALIEQQSHVAITRSLKETYNIECIQYSKGQHDLVKALIAELSYRVLEVRKERGIA